MKAAVSAFLLLALISCRVSRVPETATLSAKTISSGVFDCFPAGLKDRKGIPVYCETSAAVYDGEKLIFASDKPVPGKGLSAVFATPLPGNDLTKASFEYYDDSVFLNATKYEELTRTPDGNYMLLMTGFDRINPANSSLDHYNTLIGWKKADHKTAHVITTPQQAGATSSVSLHNELAIALRNTVYPKAVPYFKVEGLAVIPGNKLLFGVREEGKNYENFEYRVKLIQVSYEIKNDRLVPGSDYKVVYNFKPDTALTNGKTVGLSAIEYDPFRKLLYVLTSYETSEEVEGVGGFLWTLPLAGIEAQKPLKPVVNQATGKIFYFAHKPEDIAVIDRSRILIICDDDRRLGSKDLWKQGELFYREPQQAAYLFLEIR